METAALATINPNIPLSFWQASPPILQAAIKTAGRINSLPEIVSLRTEPKIATLQKKGGSQSTFGIINALLMTMNNNLHLDNHLTEGEIIKIARRLTTDPELRWWLTLADIDLLCRRIANGYFGHFYNHFSELEFNKCLAKYCHERQELHRIEADKTVSDPSGTTLTMKELGYSIGEDGRLIVPDENKERRLPQPYNKYAYKDSKKEDKMTKILNTAKIIAKTKNISLDEAITIAEQKINNLQEK